MNGDGYADIAVGQRDEAQNGVRLSLFRGGPNGITSTPAREIDPPVGQGSEFGAFVAYANDVNADGYADVVVAAPYAGESKDGRVYLYLGAENLPTGVTVEGFIVKRVDEHCLEVEVEQGQHINDVFAALDRQGIHISSMRNKANRLEEMFVNLVEGAA